MFFLLGLVFVRRLGFEYDEVIFVRLLYRPQDAFFSFHISGRTIPAMVLSYAGALKTWLYGAEFTILPQNVYTIRLPFLLIATATIGFVSATVRRCGGERAALLSSALLATDSLFLLTAVFDWGPVAMQNFLLSVCLYLVVVKHTRPYAIPLAAFTAGVAFWDKAIFFWIASSLAVTGLLLAYSSIRKALTRTRLGIASLAFALGASPLLVYSWVGKTNSFTANANFSLQDVGSKFRLVPLALNGQAMLGFLADRSLPKVAGRTDRQPARKPEMAGPSSARAIALLLVVLGGVMCARGTQQRTILWLSSAVVLAWLQAAITRDAGVFVQHLVIFYPPLFIAVGISFHAIALRLERYGALFLGLTGVVLCGLGLFNLHAYYWNLRMFSPSTFWTDADRPLAAYLVRRKDRPLLIGDWGIATQVDVRTRGVLHSQEIGFALKNKAVQPEQIREWAGAKSLVVLHTPEHSMFPDPKGRLLAIAHQAGVNVELVTVIRDGGGHPMFEIEELALWP